MQSNLRLKPKVRWDIIAPSFKMNQTEKQNKELKKQLSPKKYSTMRIKSLFVFVLIALFSLCGETAKADSFSYTYQGKTLYYTCHWYGIFDEVLDEVSVSKCDTSTIGAVVIPSQVTYNGITYSVTSIGGSAFTNCSLTSITIPNSVTSIGWYAFSGCSSLTSITIPNSVTYIDDYTFRNCSSLTSITIPNSVTFTSIGEYAFSGCSSLTSITIPNSVTSIGRYAFSGCSSLTSITIPNSVTSIGNGAFRNCSSLTSITIPNSVTSIGYETFSGCSSLTSITIPNSVTSIGKAAFYNCSSLTSVTIPNSVTSIDGHAFWGCSSLDTVTINSNSVCERFWGRDSYSGYDTVTNPRVLIIGESVTSISENAFDGCSSLVTIKIPASMTFIERYAFANCTNIDIIYSVGMCPPEVENTTSFKNVSRNAKLFVPSGSIEDYKQAKVWKEFFNIEEYNTSDSTAGIQDIDLSNTISLYPNPADKEVYLTLDNTDLGNAEAVIYDLQGKVVKTFEIKESEKSIKLDVSALQKGTYTIMISNDKTRVTKKLIKR